MDKPVASGQCDTTHWACDCVLKNMEKQKQEIKNLERGIVNLTGSMSKKIIVRDDLIKKLLNGLMFYAQMTAVCNHDDSLLCSDSCPDGGKRARLALTFFRQWELENGKIPEARDEN